MRSNNDTTKEHDATQAKATAEPQERFCPWCETKYRPAPGAKTGPPLPPTAGRNSWRNPRNSWLNMLGHVADVNAIV
jgi:hypothetical protein